MSGVVALGEPAGKPLSMIGPSKVMLATVDQVLKAFWTTLSNEPAPYWASIAERSVEMLLAPETPSLAGSEFGYTPAPSAMKPQVTTAPDPA